MPLEMVWSSPAEGLVETRRKLANAPPSRLEKRIAELADQLEAEEGLRPVGSSRKWHEVLGQAARVAATETTVLLTGESGTGKEVLARLIHRGSRRAKGPFVALNCAALPESLLESELFGHERGAFTGALSSHAGHIEQAAGGTLFLDELGEMSLAVQAKLLRVLEQREFQRIGSSRLLKADVRIIAATNRDLGEEVLSGRFRADLYYRLQVFEIAIPPLRERPEDIPALLEHFLEELGLTLGQSAEGISPAALEKMLAHSWPGNIRELRNAVERALILCDGGRIDVEHLPPAPRWLARISVPADPAAPSTFDDLEAMERSAIEKVLEQTRQNKSKAARMLGITRRKLYTRLQRFGLE